MWKFEAFRECERLTAEYPTAEGARVARDILLAQGWDVGAISPEPEVVATWSPCCGWTRVGVWDPGTMHTGLCHSKRGGELGPTIRLVVHPDDIDLLREYRDG